MLKLKERKSRVVERAQKTYIRRNIERIIERLNSLDVEMLKHLLGRFSFLTTLRIYREVVYASNPNSVRYSNSTFLPALLYMLTLEVEISKKTNMPLEHSTISLIVNGIYHLTCKNRSIKKAKKNMKNLFSELNEDLEEEIYDLEEYMFEKGNCILNSMEVEQQ